MKRKRTKLPPATQLSVLKKEVNTQLNTLASISQTRNQLLTGLGKSYGGQRDLYLALGYNKSLEYTDFYNKFSRQDIASRIITAFPDATWRGTPQVWSGEEKQDDAFETAWEEMADEKNVYHYFTRLDTLTGIGKYAVLYMGFNDIESIEDAREPVATGQKLELVYLQPYSEQNASICSYVSDPTDPRFGMPETYKLRMNTVQTSDGNISATSTGKTEIVVHASRVIHSAEDLLESNVFGTPRLEKVYNRLENLELVVGGSSESMWRTAFPGMSFELDPDADMSSADETALDAQIDEYIHSLRRYLKLQGMEAKTLDSNSESPKDHVEVLLNLISGATGIPVRILTGSERGELASTQDKENWIDRVAERRSDFAEPVILRPFIDKMIEYKILPMPKAGYTVVWDDVRALSDKDQADIGKVRAETIKLYMESGAEAVLPPEKFYTMIMGMELEEAQSILDDVIDLMNDEREDAQEAQEVETEEEEE